jgi:hypothetical protein
MTYELVSTISWNVLGTFEDEATTRTAVDSVLAQPGSSMHDLVLYISDDTGATIEELSDHQLAEWAGISGAEPGGLRNPLLVAR